jgi:F0F1-type ATP synthase assembly protein I
MKKIPNKKIGKKRKSKNKLIQKQNKTEQKHKQKQNHMTKMSELYSAIPPMSGVIIGYI